MNKRLPLFYAVTALFWFSLYTYVPFVTSYAESLGASIRLTGLIAGSYGFAQMLVRIPLGILSDVTKKRKLFIIIGIGFSMLSGIGVFLFQNQYALLIFRSTSGIAAASWVLFTILFSSYFQPHESVKAIGFLNAANSLGTVAALFLGGVLARAYGMEYTFLLAFAAGTVALLLSMGIVENRNIQKEPLHIKDIVEVSKDKQLLLVSALAIISQYIVFTTTYGFTPMIATELGADSFQIGLLSMTSTLPGLFVSPLAGTVFLRKIGARKTIIGGLALGAISCIAIPFSTNLPLLYITQFIGSIGTSTVFTLLMGLCIANVADNKRATAMGFFQAIYGLGMFFGPSLAGLLGQSFGLSSAFIFTGIVGFVGATVASFAISE